MKFFDGLLNSVNAKRTTRASGEAPAKEPCKLCRTFARNLQAAREEAGLSRRKLAGAADVSERHIWLIETTAFNVTLETVTALAKHVGKPELQLLTPVRKKKSKPIKDIEE